MNSRRRLPSSIQPSSYYSKDIRETIGRLQNSWKARRTHNSAGSRCCEGLDATGIARFAASRQAANPFQLVGAKISVLRRRGKQFGGLWLLLCSIEVGMGSLTNLGQ
mmetsp:Transcript_46301/g.83438  ORF Transcript_46301/g.83438 Transcript_46301/m.83438 type:complete len:107 (-) Transcript_46301:8-328(-)